MTQIVLGPTDTAVVCRDGKTFETFLPGQGQVQKLSVLLAYCASQLESDLAFRAEINQRFWAVRDVIQAKGAN